MESANDPANDPVLMWFNGGPGCSSMLGFFQENGPFVVDDDNNTIYANPYSWNSNANVLYFEMPAGVGFSVGDTPYDLTHNDYTQSTDMLAALTGWYDRFPDFKKHELFISGESYGGIYVPYLSWQIYEYNLKMNVTTGNKDSNINLKGFAVGNGVTNWKYDTEPSLPATLYGFNMISTKTYKSFTENGCVIDKDGNTRSGPDAVCQALFG